MAGTWMLALHGHHQMDRSRTRFGLHLRHLLLPGHHADGDLDPEPDPGGQARHDGVGHEQSRWDTGPALRGAQQHPRRSRVTRRPLRWTLSSGRDEVGQALLVVASLLAALSMIPLVVQIAANGGAPIASAASYQQEALQAARA